MFTTRAILDWDIYVGARRVVIKGTHDLVRLFDDKLKEQNRVLSDIRQILARYSREHEGIWVYGANDDGEREFRVERARQEAEEAAESRRQIDQLRRKLVPHEFPAEPPTLPTAAGTEPRSSRVPAPPSPDPEPESSAAEPK